MKIKLKNEKAGYFSVRKKEDEGEVGFGLRMKTERD